MKKICVSDVTLKAVAEQDLSLTFREKLAIAERIDASRVDAIELPTLTASKENEVICRTIACSVKNVAVKIPVGSSRESVLSTFESVKGAKSVCLQVVMPVSTTLMEYFYHLKAPAMVGKIEELVSTAKEVCDSVEFVALDVFRADSDFVVQCVKTACSAGVTEVTICDDAGIAFPEDYEKIVKEIKGSCDVKLSVQPSNALSLACASAISAINAGADGVKTSAIGEYLTSATLCDVMRAKKYAMGVDCDVDVTNVKSIVSAINGLVDEKKAIDQPIAEVGVLNATATMKEVAESVKQLGYELTDSDVGKVYEEFKKLTSKKEAIDTKELEAVVASTAMQVPSTYHLINYVVNSGNIIPATANVTLEKDGEKFTGVSTGDGPIDAAFHAIEQIIGHHYELDDFQVHAITKGRGAVGSSIIRLRADGKLYPGNGVSTDIVGACIRAYINALNKIVYEGD